MSTFKALSKEFKPKIVPIVRGEYQDILSSVTFPIFVQGIPEGIPILIRSGLLKTSAGHNIVNYGLKAALAPLIRSTRIMKLTVEATVMFNKTYLTKEAILGKLLNYDDRGENLKIVLTDMVIEHSPHIMDYESRHRSMKGLFKPSICGNAPLVIDTAKVSSRKELEDQILAFHALGYTKYRVASPKSKYIFGTPEELYSEGGIADIDSTTVFKGTLLGITPRILTIGRKLTYVADKLLVRFRNSTESISIDLSNENVVLTAKVWENKEALLGDTVVFSGLMLPNFTYPKMKKFIRFEKSN